jgi:histidinol dehydrogenase
MALGTASVPRCDKLFGPGNAWVDEAKRQAAQRPGGLAIDMPAGPSEVLVIADRHANPAWVAADLLAQAEHDSAAQAMLMTDDAGLAEAVVAEVEAQVQSLPRRALAAASWRDFGAVILLGSLDEAPALADRIAAEHLEIATVEPEQLAARISNAGAIFLGGHTPEAIGDYVGGSNHVLPTARSARFASGLGVADFLKRTSLLHCSPASLAALAPAAMALGRAEGLEAHARSVAIRTNRGR